MAKPGIYRKSKEDTQRLLDYAEETGWSYSLAKAGHIKFTRAGCQPVFFSSSAGDWRATKNCKSLLRRYAQGV